MLSFRSLARPSIARRLGQRMLSGARMFCANPVIRGKDVSCSVKHGRVSAALPLPHGATLFSLAPHTDVGSLAKDVARESQASDGAADVHVETVDGIRVARSHMLGPLMKAGSFYVVIGEKKHLLTLPSQALEGDNVDESLEHVQRLVRDLYTTLDTPRMVEMETRKCEEDLKQTLDKVKPLNDKCTEITRLANRRANVAAWGGLALMSLQFGVLWELSFNIFSWDLMEPVTYFVGYGTMIVFAAYHCITNQEHTYEGFHRRQYSIGFHKHAKKRGLDVAALTTLTDRVSHLQAKLDRLRGI